MQATPSLRFATGPRSTGAVNDEQLGLVTRISVADRLAAKATPDGPLLELRGRSHHPSMEPPEPGSHLATPNPDLVKSSQVRYEFPAEPSGVVNDGGLYIKEPPVSTGLVRNLVYLARWD